MERNLTPEEARTGRPGGRVLLVLVISFGCAALALGLVWLFFFSR